MSRFAAQLEKARTFVEAARRVCDEVKRVGAQNCVVVLNHQGGPLALTIDNYEGIPDAFRLHAVTREFWDTDPVLTAMRGEVRPIGKVDTRDIGAQVRSYGYQGPDGEVFVTPILGSNGWCGMSGCLLPSGYDVAIERELAMITTHLSVWCTQRGIAAVPHFAADRLLGERQHRIAELAARGHTNAEIADALGISINTVKSRLKEVFERLAVHNRTELANELRRLAPLQGIPAGVTRYKSVSITRGARTQRSGSTTRKP